MKAEVSIALAGLGLLFTCLASARVTVADDLPPCNGQTATGSVTCGERRFCDDTTGCLGTAVSAKTVPKECGDGAANELCELQTLTCTATYHCKSPVAPATGCVTDFNNPALDSDNKPIISTSSIPALKSCSAT